MLLGKSAQAWQKDTAEQSFWILPLHLTVL